MVEISREQTRGWLVNYTRDRSQGFLSFPVVLGEEFTARNFLALISTARSLEMKRSREFQLKLASAVPRRPASNQQRGGILKTRVNKGARNASAVSRKLKTRVLYAKYTQISASRSGGFSRSLVLNSSTIRRRDRVFPVRSDVSLPIKILSAVFLSWTRKLVGLFFFNEFFFRSLSAPSPSFFFE